MTRRQSLLVTIGLMLGVLLEAIYSTTVSTAVPSILSDLGNVTLVGWVFSSYLLTSTITTPIYGKLSDTYGRMPFYLLGMIVFMVGSVASALAQNMVQLVLFRGLQGVGSGAMMPIAIALAQTVYPPQERGKLQGAISGAYGVASVLGPTLGGFMVDHLGWRWIFLMGIPFGILAVILLYLNVPDVGRRNLIAQERPSIDYWGALTLGLSSVALLLGFIWGGDQSIGWTNSQTLLAFVISLMTFVCFVLIERKAKEPLILFATFRSRTFTLSVVISFMTGAAMLAVMSYLPTFVQGVLAQSATNSGLIVSPIMIALVIGTTIAGRTLGRRIHRYKWMAICASTLMACATVGMTTFTQTTPLWLVIIAMAMFGLGLGLTFPLYTIAVSFFADQRYLGISIALVTFFRNMGGAISVAILGSVLTHQLANAIPARIRGSVPAAVYGKLPINVLTSLGTRILTNNNLLKQMQAQFARFDPSGSFFKIIISAMRLALSDAIHSVFIGATIITVVALITTLALKNERIIFKSIPHKGRGDKKGTGASEEVAV